MVKKDDESTLPALQLMFDKGQMRDPGEKITSKNSSISTR
jgi:hypothetical protein